MTKQGNYFPQLTGLRAIAAYLVYLFHYPIAPYEALFAQFHIGVGMFFTLSGFLIYYRYAESYAFTKQWWKTYLLNRFARIYPLYFLLTVLALGYASGSLFEWFAHLTLVRGFFLGLARSGLEQAWTLTVEECFYISAPFLFLAFSRGKFWSPLFLLYGIGVLLTLFGQRINFYGFFEDFAFLALDTYFGRALDFFLGMYLAKKFMASRSESIPPAQNSRQWATFLSITGLIALILLRAWLLVNWGMDGRQPLTIALNNLAFPLCNVFLLWGLLTEDTLVSRFLASPMMVLLGKSSYAFYLIHIGIIAIIVLYLSSLIIPNNHLALLLHFIFMNGVAIFLFRYIEEPLNHLIRRGKQPKLALEVKAEAD
jgi:peptidoglycan/LPS O-acetylase OafA/YrhL